MQISPLILFKELSRLYRSKFWRSTGSLRVIMIQAGKVYTLTRRIRNGLGYIVRGDFEGLRNRLRSIRNDQFLQNCAQSGPPKHWGIMATFHTLFIAHLVASRLRAHGWIGCGLSYSCLGRHALKHRIQRLTVLEDDVLLPVDFEDKMLTIQAYLV